jgi:hypothetical protein
VKRDVGSFRYLKNAVFAAGFSLTSVSFAQDGHVSVTNTAVGEYRTDNQNGNPDDDNYGAFIDRFNINGGFGDVSASARLDAERFLEPPSEDFENQFRLERLNAKYNFNDWVFEAGDFYNQYGQGLVLSVRKLDEAGIDIAIRGGHLRYEGSTHTVDVFAGVANSANMDSISQHAVEDKMDILTGYNYEFYPTDSLRVGTYGLYNQPEERILDTTDYTLNAGVYMDLPSLADWLILYMEFAVQQKLLADSPAPGSAAYVNSELRFGDFAIIDEAMFLNEFEQKGSRNTALDNRFDYSRPPTLERLDQEVINNRDVLGNRLRVEYFFFDWDLLLFANGMYRINDITEDSELHQLHGYTGAEFNFDEGASRVTSMTGYRHEQQQGATEPIKTIQHLDVDYLQYLGSGFSLHLTSGTQYRWFADKNYLQGSTFAGIEKAGIGGVTFELGYDTFDPTPGVRNIFYAGIFSWEVTDEIHLSGTVGNQRGGIKCIAGVCREYPAFSGAKGTLITRF